LASIDLCWILIEKICLETILDAVNDRERRNQNALLSAENARKEMQNLG
jgi:F-type H+-transporting ATPase subunit b